MHDSGIVNRLTTSGHLGEQANDLGYRHPLVLREAFSKIATSNKFHRIGHEVPIGEVFICAYHIWMRHSVGRQDLVFETRGRNFILSYLGKEDLHSHYLALKLSVAARIHEPHAPLTEAFNDLIFAAQNSSGL
jgi:hypothetical protein